MMKEFEDAFEAAHKKKPFSTKKGVYFTSLEAARNFLTPKRMEILHVVREKNPHSLYELAKWTRRGFSSVLRDVEMLAKHGLIKLNKPAKSPRKIVFPEVEYDAISLWIGV
jgi:predicted transcriptional regulator